MGNLIVYGTIIGILGNRNANFKEDLVLQIEDFKRFGKDNHLCIMGDFNISFNNHYFTHHGRNALTNIMFELNLINLTADVETNIDHIVISLPFLPEPPVSRGEWNTNPKYANPPLSDHQGVWVNLK